MQQCHISEVNFKVYKPIEVWKCKSIDEAIEKCEENREKNCWVYLEITSDRYIREDEIKKMKDLKKYILEITPKIIGEDDFKDEENFAEKPFEDIFKEFYKKERGAEPEEELVELLMSVLLKEGDKDETN